MTDQPRELFDLQPAIHRIRDARLAQEAGLDRGPREELIAVMAAEIAERLDLPTLSDAPLLLEAMA